MKLNVNNDNGGVEDKKKGDVACVVFSQKGKKIREAVPDPGLRCTGEKERSEAQKVT